jgi:hypothetical protein
MSEFKIEKGIELVGKGGRGAKSVYPFNDLEVGDSFFVYKKDKTVVCVRQAACQHNKRFPEQKLEWRTNEQGIRVWRTK